MRSIVEGLAKHQASLEHRHNAPNVQCRLRLRIVPRHGPVQTSMALPPAALHPDMSATWTQRRFRSHAAKPYSAPQRLIAPAKGYRAVQARKLLQEIDRLEGTRFSHVTIQPRVPSKYSPAYLRAMGALTPNSTSASKAVKFFKRGLETQLSSLTSAFGWAPVEWPGSILFIDMANCGGCLNVRNLDKSVKAYRSTLSDLKRFSQHRGCRVHVMVYVLLSCYSGVPIRHLIGPHMSSLILVG